MRSEITCSDVTETTTIHTRVRDYIEVSKNTFRHNKILGKLVKQIASKICLLWRHPERINSPSRVRNNRDVNNIRIFKEKYFSDLSTDSYGRTKDNGKIQFGMCRTKIIEALLHWVKYFIASREIIPSLR